MFITLFVGSRPDGQYSYYNLADQQDDWGGPQSSLGHMQEAAVGEEERARTGGRLAGDGIYKVIISIIHESRNSHFSRILFPYILG